MTCTMFAKRAGEWAESFNGSGILQVIYVHFYMAAFVARILPITVTNVTFAITKLIHLR